MPKEFETKRVLVTGAASGIGQAQAIAFAEQGAEPRRNGVKADSRTG